MQITELLKQAIDEAPFAAGPHRPREGPLTEMHDSGGMPAEESAEVLSLAWLHQEMAG